MFGVDSSELAVVAVLALIFIGPKDLPKVMRTVGYWVGRVRGMARHFTSGIENMVREAELEEMEKKWREENERIMQLHPAERALSRAGPAADDNAAGRRCREQPPQPKTSLRPRSGRCREGHRRHQAAAARASDRAPATAAAGAWRRSSSAFFVCFYFRQGHFRGPGPAVAPGGAGQAHLHRHFRGVFRRGEGRAVRGADAQLSGARDADVAVRRARPLRQGEKALSCRSC